VNLGKANFDGNEMGQDVEQKNAVEAGGAKGQPSRIGPYHGANRAMTSPGRRLVDPYHSKPAAKGEIHAGPCPASDVEKV
jgi:hypothetical protein